MNYIYVPVSVSERIPEKNGHYFVIDSEGVLTTSMFIMGELPIKWVDVEYDDEMACKVTHWLEKREVKDGIEAKESEFDKKNVWGGKNNSIDKEQITTILEKRIVEAFSDGCHNYEHNRLRDAIQAIKELVPPSLFAEFASLHKPVNEKMREALKIVSERFNKSIDAGFVANDNDLAIIRKVNEALASSEDNDGVENTVYTTDEPFDEETYHCGKCKVQINIGDKYCTDCGTKIRWHISPPTNNAK